MRSSYFLSHGSPDEVLHDSPARIFWRGRLRHELADASAMVVMSAHFESPELLLGGHSRPPTIHDFGPMFDQQLFERQWPAPGQPDMAAGLLQRLELAGIPARIDATSGLDHGVWTVLGEALPEAAIPIIPISVCPNRDARFHFEVGRAIAPLGAGVVAIGTGALTHNLVNVDWLALRSKPYSSPDRRAVAFADWIAARIVEGNVEALLNWRKAAPEAAFNHPTPEHLHPLFFALGAAAEHRQAEVLFRSYAMKTLAMDAMGFD